MIRRPTSSTRTYTLVPFPTLFRTPARDEDPARSRRQGRRGPAQHALRRRRAPEDRLRVAEEAQSQADLLPHARLRAGCARGIAGQRSEEHTSELQSLMRSSYAGFGLKKKKTKLDYKPPLPYP